MFSYIGNFANLMCTCNGHKVLVLVLVLEAYEGTCTRTCTWGLSTCTCTRTWGLGTCTCTCTWGLSTWYISGKPVPLHFTYLHYVSTHESVTIDQTMTSRGEWSVAEMRGYHFLISVSYLYPFRSWKSISVSYPYPFENGLIVQVRLQGSSY